MSHYSVRMMAADIAGCEHVNDDWGALPVSLMVRLSSFPQRFVDVGQLRVARIDREISELLRLWIYWGPDAEQEPGFVRQMRVSACEIEEFFNSDS